MSFNKERLKEIFLSNGIELKCEAQDAFITYAEMLVERNKEVNLTAITEPEEIYVKHFLDSALLSKALDIKPGTKFADVGTGAGFPGIPIAILHPEIKLYLIDSLNKRLVFVKEVCEKLGIKCEIIHKRAEECGREEVLRDKMDIVSARAVAPLSVLSEYCLPLVSKGGVFAAMKGPGAEEECKEAENAIEKLSGKLTQIKSFTLPGEQTRNIILIEKIAPTDKAYPRRSTKISKNPL